VRIGLNLGGQHHSLETVRAAVRQAAEDGLAGAWMSQIFGLDSLTALAVVGPEFPGLDLGVSVVPIYGRHPLALAMQALTVQEAVGGRLILGIGPSHQITVEGLYGQSYAKPYTRTEEYLRALLPLLAGEAADVSGEEITARGSVAVDAPAPPPVLVAALGPKMLRLAGTESAGTSLWMVGPRTIADHIVPTITQAAADAGRPSPRILAGITVCVTDNPDAARDRAAAEQAMYGTLPAYQRVLQAEGVEGPGGLVITGDEETVAAGINRYGEAGATDLRVTIVAAGDEELERTRAVLRSLI
jgi:F420-dependent oxidoreductase-like protein